MKTIQKEVFLSTLWILLTVNYIFCDVFTLMHSDDLKQILEGKVGDMELTQEFLLSFAFIMEIPMLMILLSRVLKWRTNRIVNIATGIFLAAIQGWSLTTGGNTMHYVFFSIIEVGICLSIVWTAWQWKTEKVA